MIHVDRPPDPLPELKVRETGPTAAAYREPLRTLFRDKCAFCEDKVDPLEGFIDHFRPVSAYPELAQQWSNLYYSCPTCNAYKGSSDPVNPDTGELWLLDPCLDDPGRFLHFLADGTVAPRPGIARGDMERAAWTLRSLGLNRGALVARRAILVQELEARCREGDSGDMWRYADPARPFSAAARDALRRWYTGDLVVAPTWTAPSLIPEPHLVKRITLAHIGPFMELDIPLDAGWNLFLGRNNAGKSTLLRAVALALLGNAPDATRFVTGFLSPGVERGFIRLETDHFTYHTSLVALPEGVVVSPGSDTLAQRGRWAAFAFPALRGIPGGALSGRKADGRGGPWDLLPILEGPADSRLHDVRQWVVSMAMQVENSRVESGERDRIRMTIIGWFKVLKGLMPGEGLEFVRVDAEQRILVRSGGSVIPLESLSQGMLSTIGWVGTLLRRLYELYPKSPEPSREHALVLVDELDAHLHPAWQREIVPLLHDVFPNVQFLATSHSPYVALGVAATARGQDVRAPITLLERRGDHIVAAPVSPSPRGWNVARVLTHLLDVPDLRDPITSKDIERFERMRMRRLLDELNEQELREFHELWGSLDQILGDSPESPLSRDLNAIREWTNSTKAT